MYVARTAMPAAVLPPVQRRKLAVFEHDQPTRLQNIAPGR